MSASDDLRPMPSGFPAVSLMPPTVAESGDPFAALRILLSTLRRPTRWRSREYGRLGG